MYKKSTKEILICVLTTVLLYVVSIECANCPGTAVGVCSGLSSSGRVVYLSGVTASDNTSHCHCTAKIVSTQLSLSELGIAAVTNTSGSCNEYLVFNSAIIEPKVFSSCSDNVTESGFLLYREQEFKILLFHRDPTPSFSFCLRFSPLDLGRSVNIDCVRSIKPEIIWPTNVTPVGGGNQGSTSTNNGGVVTQPGNNGGGATSSNSGGGATSSNNDGGATSNNGGGATSPNNGGGATSSNNGGGVTSSNNGGGATSSNNGGGATSPNNGGGVTSSNNGGATSSPPGNGGGTNNQIPPGSPGDTETGTNPSASSLDESDLGIILGVVIVILLIIIIVVLFFCAKKKMKKRMKIDIAG